MASKKKILVLTDDMPWGHRSIAKAIYSFLADKAKGTNDLEVKYAEVGLRMGILNDVYTFIYRFMPSTNRITNRLMERELPRHLFEELSVNNLPNLKKVINWHKPDLVICCYFFHSHSLAKWRAKEGKDFKLWTVVADPWSMNPITFVKEADLNLVYDQNGLETAKKYDVPEERVMVTGWWVRPEMYKKYNREEARKKLGFEDNRPVIFVGGGSLGNNSLTRVLPVLMFIKRKVGFIFNTGTDKLAYRMVDEYVKFFKRWRKDDMVKIKNLGWIENMAEVLTASDLVLGKAGPNFLFDVMAVGKPFVAITHIGGQEDGNIELIDKKGLGWIKEKNGQLAEMILEYLKSPSRIAKKFEKNIAKEGESNRESLGKVFRRVCQELGVK
jgi:UDP-N-acetylglucosamine:LPS N-acetylglucosamine transferase